MNKELLIINDISRLNPILVDKIIAPTTTEEIREIILSNQGPISIGGARCSMGGQTALENSFHIDMRQFNKVIEFNKKAQTITVQTGITWHEIQKYIDPHNLAIKIMQTYANFTVGGTLSVNSHGRYMGLGPVILSTKQIKVILADGSIIEADRTNNPDIFFGIIGGYGGLGVIIEVTLELVDNSKIERISKKLSIEDYPQYFAENIKNSTKVIFHNADLYPSEYKKVMAISWIITDKDLTSQDRLRKIKKTYLFEKYFLWAISETPLGKYRREYLYDPIILNSKKIVWRNNEASYNFLELEPLSRKKSTYVLQEYFIPIDNINEFIPKMAKILQRYEVNVINISIRHAIKDPGTLLAWAEDEVFAFVLYYKQYTNEVAKNKVAIWTREIIESALECNGSYYLPYQPHATPEQFHRAYPRANDYFALKKKLDPDTKFLNKLWEQYYLVGAQAITNNKSESDFKNIFLDTYWRDKFYLFLQNVYNIYT